MGKTLDSAVIDHLFLQDIYDALEIGRLLCYTLQLQDLSGQWATVGFPLLRRLSAVPSDFSLAESTWCHTVLTHTLHAPSDRSCTVTEAISIIVTSP